MKLRLQRKRFVGCIAALTALSLFGSAALAHDAQSYQTAAAVAVSTLDYERAIQIYSKGLEQQFSTKDLAGLFLMRGIVAHLAKKRDQAEADFNTAVKMIGDTDSRAYRERGFFYDSEGRLDLALADYTAGAKRFPSEGTFPYRQGMVLNNQHKFDEAISRFNEAMKLDPKSSLFVLGRAEAYTRSDRSKEALEDYDRALTLGGHLTENDTYRLRVGVGSAHMKLKDYKAAIKSLDAAVELSPKSTTALRYRGLAFELSGDIDRASQDYETVLRLKPGEEFVTSRLQKLRKNKNDQLRIQ